MTCQFVPDRVYLFAARLLHPRSPLRLPRRRRRRRHRCRRERMAAGPVTGATRRAVASPPRGKFKVSSPLPIPIFDTDTISKFAGRPRVTRPQCVSTHVERAQISGPALLLHPTRAPSSTWRTVTHSDSDGDKKPEANRKPAAVKNKRLGCRFLANNLTLILLPPTLSLNIKQTHR